MRILHVVTTLDVGGAETHLLALVRGQVERGHVVRVAYLKGGGALAEDFRAAGAEAVLALGLSVGTPTRLVREMFAAEIVHSHLLKADMLCALLATLFGLRGRLVSSKHNDEQVLRRRAIARVHAVLGRAPRRTIVLSDHVGRFFVAHGGLDPARIVRIHYGLDPARFEAAAARPPAEHAALRASLGLGGAEVVFVCVARFAPQKAHEVLLAALRRALDELRADEPRLRLLLVGDDPFGDGRVRAEERARGLELGDAVVFAGIRRDVPELVAASDVFVMASRWEGFGLVFLEAMACAKPVLATDVSAIPEVVARDQTGLLVPPDDPAALATAMLRLARDPALRERFGRAGANRRRALFGVDRMVEETLAVYATVWGAGR